MNEKDVLKIMAEAAYEEAKKHDVIPFVPMWADLPDKTKARFVANQRAALTALEAEGYTISRSSHGVVHRQEPFEGGEAAVTDSLTEKAVNVIARLLDPDAFTTWEQCGDMIIAIPPAIDDPARLAAANERALEIVSALAKAGVMMRKETPEEYRSRIHTLA